MTARVVGDIPEGLHPDLPDADHHRIDALGSTDLKHLLRSPARFRWERDNPTPPTGAMDVGSITHALALGVGSRFVVSPYDAYRSNESKAWRAQQRDAGLIVVTQKDHDLAEAMADALFEHRVAGPLLGYATHVEATALATVGDVPCKARYDALIPEAGLDVKTTAEPDLDDEALSRAVTKYHYEIQGGAYADVMDELGEPVRDHLLLWVSSAPPHFVAVRRIVPSALDLGREMAAAARAVYRRHLATGEWPGPRPFADLDVRPWAYSQTTHLDLMEDPT